MQDNDDEPLIQLLRVQWEPSAIEPFTVDGLPDPQWLCRQLAVGETIRKGDYALSSGRWYPAPERHSAPVWRRRHECSFDPAHWSKGLLTLDLHALVEQLLHRLGHPRRPHPNA
jgi:hypothetical protein